MLQSLVVVNIFLACAFMSPNRAINNWMIILTVFNQYIIIELWFYHCQYCVTIKCKIDTSSSQFSLLIEYLFKNNCFRGPEYDFKLHSALMAFLVNRVSLLSMAIRLFDVCSYFSISRLRLPIWALHRKAG